MDNNIDIPVERLNEPGNIWIRPQNNQLRYGTNGDKAASWLNPLPVYKVSKTVKYGQPVTLTDYSEEHSIKSGNARERTIVPTNSQTHSSCIGIALNYGEKEDEVHIQNNGEIVYDIKNYTNDKYWLPPYNIIDDSPIFEWTDKDVGSTVYISKDGFTLNVDEASSGTIMSVGKIAFAPTANEKKLDQQKIIIHLQAGGDDRGVKDTSQFTIQMSPVVDTDSIESNNDMLLFIKINDSGLGEFILTDEDITKDMSTSPVGAIVVPSENGLCNLAVYKNKKVTVTRLGLLSGRFGFAKNNVGRIGLINNGRVAFSSAQDYNVKVGIFKEDNDGYQNFLVDCRFPVESASSGEKIGTIKPVFGPNNAPYLDVGFAKIDDDVHRVVFLKNDNIDTSKIDWYDLVESCYSKDIFEFGRKDSSGNITFTRFLESPEEGITWAADTIDTDETWGIFNSQTFFKFRNLYYTIGKHSDEYVKAENYNEFNTYYTKSGENYKLVTDVNEADFDTYYELVHHYDTEQVACQIKFALESLNTNEECIWPEEAYTLKLKATSDKDDYVLGGSGFNSTLKCNITRLVEIGNYMDRDGANIESYSIMVRASTGQLLSPGFYQNSEGKWCGYEWFLYEKSGLYYLYMSTIPNGAEAKDCNGINITSPGQKMKSSDNEETLIVTVRRRPSLYNAVYLNQYLTNNPWTPYIDGNTGNIITEDTIYFGTPEKMLLNNKTEDENATSGKTLKASGRTGKIELTTENSEGEIKLTTQVRGISKNPVLVDTKEVFDGNKVSNNIKWTYKFKDNITELNSYFAPILISKATSLKDVNITDFSTTEEPLVDYDAYLAANDFSAMSAISRLIFKEISHKDSEDKKPLISFITDDERTESKKIFKDTVIDGNIVKYNDKESLFIEDLIKSGKYINYMSLLSLMGMSLQETEERLLKLERSLFGVDFNKDVSYDENLIFSDKATEYVNAIGLLRLQGYLDNSLILTDLSESSLKYNDYYMPGKNYASIIDRFNIENFYDYDDENSFLEAYNT